jgi:hypothetical protein
LGLLFNGKQLTAWQFNNPNYPQCLINLDIIAAIQEWNQVVNTLKLQANVTVEYLEKLHKALFGTYTSATTGLNEFEDEGVINTLLTIISEFNFNLDNLQDGQFIRYDGTTEAFKATTANKVVVSSTTPTDNKNNDIWFEF